MNAHTHTHAHTTHINTYHTQSKGYAYVEFYNAQGAKLALERCSQNFHIDLSAVVRHAHTHTRKHTCSHMHVRIGNHILTHMYTQVVRYASPQQMKQIHFQHRINHNKQGRMSTRRHTHTHTYSHMQRNNRNMHMNANMGTNTYTHEIHMRAHTHILLQKHNTQSHVHLCMRYTQTNIWNSFDIL